MLSDNIDPPPSPPPDAVIELAGELVIPLQRDGRFLGLPTLPLRKFQFSRILLLLLLPPPPLEFPLAIYWGGGGVCGYFPELHINEFLLTWKMQ